MIAIPLPKSLYPLSTVYPVLQLCCCASTPLHPDRSCANFTGTQRAPRARHADCCSKTCKRSASHLNQRPTVVSHCFLSVCVFPYLSHVTLSAVWILACRLRPSTSLSNCAPSSWNNPRSLHATSSFSSPAHRVVFLTAWDTHLTSFCMLCAGSKPLSVSL